MSSKTTTPNLKRKYNSTDCSGPFTDTPEVATQRDDFMELELENYDDDDNDDDDNDDDDEAVEDSEEEGVEEDEEVEEEHEEEEEETRGHVLGKRNLFGSEKEKGGQPANVAEKDGLVRVGLKRVPARKTIELSSDSEDDIHVAFDVSSGTASKRIEKTKSPKNISGRNQTSKNFDIEDEAQLETNRSSNSSGKTAGSYVYKFENEYFNNVPSPEKGGLENDLRLMYESFLSKRKGHKTREVKEHALIFNLETLVLMLAYDKMFTEENQIPTKEQYQLIQLNIELLMETLPTDPRWRKNLFVHFTAENGNNNPSDETAVFSWPPEFVSHMNTFLKSEPRKISKAKSGTTAKRTPGKGTPGKDLKALKAANEAAEAKGKTILERIRAIKLEIKNYVNSVYPDMPVSGNNKNTLLFKIRGFLYTMNRQRLIKTNWQKKNSEKKKKNKDETKKDESAMTSDDICELAEQEWSEEWKSDNHVFKEDWFPRYWLYFLYCGKAAPEGHRNISIMVDPAEMQKTEHQGRQVRRKAKEVLQAKARTAQQRAMQESEEIDEDVFVLEKPSPQTNSRKNSSSFSDFQDGKFTIASSFRDIVTSFTAPANAFDR